MFKSVAQILTEAGFSWLSNLLLCSFLLTFSLFFLTVEIYFGKIAASAGQCLKRIVLTYSQFEYTH